MPMAILLITVFSVAVWRVFAHFSKDKKDSVATSRYSGENGNIRGIADYIAGMTDRFAIVEYERIFNPRQLSMINLIP